MIFVSDDPSARALRTNASSRKESTSARTIRATGGHIVTPSNTTTLTRLPPNTNAIDPGSGAANPGAVRT